jgi:hypothetical protein
MGGQGAVLCSCACRPAARPGHASCTNIFFLLATRCCSSCLRCSHCIDPVDRRRIERLEIFDEFEEWHLIQARLSCKHLAEKGTVGALPSCILACSIRMPRSQPAPPAAATLLHRHRRQGRQRPAAALWPAALPAAFSAGRRRGGGSAAPRGAAASLCHVTGQRFDCMMHVLLLSGFR